MRATEPTDHAYTTAGERTDASRSEDETCNNVEISVWHSENVDDRTVLRFSPSHARMLAQHLLWVAQVMDDEQHPAAEKR